MTPEGYKKHKAVIEAWAEGKPIQYRMYEYDPWNALPLNHDMSWVTSYQYRVAPQETYTWQNVYATSTDFIPDHYKSKEICFSRATNGYTHIGYLKRTYLDSQFVTAEFIPLDKE